MKVMERCGCKRLAGGGKAFLSETLLQRHFSKSVFPEILWCFHPRGGPLQCWGLSWTGVVTADFAVRAASAPGPATTTPCFCL